MKRVYILERRRGCREEKHSPYQDIGISNAFVQYGMQTFHSSRGFIPEMPGERKPLFVEECKEKRPEGYCRSRTFRIQYQLTLVVAAAWVAIFSPVSLKSLSRATLENANCADDTPLDSSRNITCIIYIIDRINISISIVIYLSLIAIFLLHRNIGKNVNWKKYFFVIYAEFDSI